MTVPCKMQLIDCNNNNHSNKDDKYDNNNDNDDDDNKKPTKLSHLTDSNKLMQKHRKFLRGGRADARGSSCVRPDKTSVTVVCEVSLVVC